MDTQQFKFDSPHGEVEVTCTVQDRAEFSTEVAMKGTVDNKPFEGSFVIREGRDDLEVTGPPMASEVATAIMLAMDEMDDSILMREMSRICG